MKIKVRIPFIFTKSRPMVRRNKVLPRKQKHKEKITN